MRRSSKEETRKAQPPEADRADVGASGRAIAMARVIDRLCRAPGTYHITVVVPVHRRSPWQITYARLEIVRKEIEGRE